MFKDLKKVGLKNLPMCIGCFIAGCALVGLAIYIMMPVFTGQQAFSDLRKNELKSGQIIMCLIGCAILWLFSGVFLSGVFNSDKKVRKYCQEHDAWDKVEQFYKDTKPIRGNLRISREFILGILKSSIIFLPVDELIWVYPNVVTVKQAGVITVAKNYYIYFCSKDGSKQSYPLESESQTALITEFLQKMFPWAAAGYTEELNYTFEHERNNMISAVEERRQAYSQMTDSAEN